MNITTSKFRRLTLWDRIKMTFGGSQPIETTPLSGGTWEYTGTVDSSKSSEKYIYDTEGKQFKQVDL